MEKRGQVTYAIIIGTIILITVASVTYIINEQKISELDQESAEISRHSNIKDQVDVFMTACLAEATEEALDMIAEGSGYMIDKDTLPSSEDFHDIGLLHYSGKTIRTYVDAQGNVFPVYVFAPKTDIVKEGNDYPCLKGTCDMKYIFSGDNYPFGKGALGSYDFDPGIPQLYKDDRDPMFIPGCEDSCEYSVEYQLERTIYKKGIECYNKTLDTFNKTPTGEDYIDFSESLGIPSYDEYITLSKESQEELLKIAITERNVEVIFSPEIKGEFQETSFTLDSFRYTSMKKLKALYVSLFGGSINNAVGLTGIVESEARDPFFQISHGQTMVENVMGYPSSEIAVTQKRFESGTEKVTVKDVRSDYNFTFLVENRRPFISYVGLGSAKISERDHAEFTIGTDQTYWDNDDCPSDAKSAMVELTYEISFDAHDPDDDPNDPIGDFRSKADGLTIQSASMIDSSCSGTLSAEIEREGSSIIVILTTTPEVIYRSVDEFEDIKKTGCGCTPAPEPACDCDEACDSEEDNDPLYVYEIGTEKCSGITCSSCSQADICGTDADGNALSCSEYTSCRSRRSNCLDRKQDCIENRDAAVAACGGDQACINHAKYDMTKICRRNKHCIVDSFFGSVDIGVSVADQHGNTDYIEFTVGANYQYGPSMLLSAPGSSKPALQYTPWIIPKEASSPSATMPEKNCDPCGSSCQVHFYDTRSLDAAGYNMSKIDLWDNNPFDQKLIWPYKGVEGPLYLDGKNIQTYLKDKIDSYRSTNSWGYNNGLCPSYPVINASSGEERCGPYYCCVEIGLEGECIRPPDPRIGSFSASVG